nr:uncharacterized protein LOC113708318 [Coffea arabica]
MSRAKNKSSIKILIKPAIFSTGEDSITHNVVYREKLPITCSSELQDDRKVIGFAEIVPGLQYWTTIAQVLDKQKPLLSKAGNRYQKLTLIDNQGITVEAMIYKSDIEFFRNHFNLYKRYMISNARVEYTPLEYRAHENQCTWYIDNSTIVQAIDEASPPEIPSVFTFTPFRRFYQHIDDTSDIDTLGIVAQVHPRNHRGPTPTREIVIIDNSFMPVILTCGNQAADNSKTTLENCLHSCNKQVNVVPRCRLTIELADYSGMLTLDLYDNDAEQLLPFTLLEIQELEDKHQLNYIAIEQAIENTILTCFVKKMMGNRGSGDTEKYTAIIVHKANAPEIISKIPTTPASIATSSTCASSTPGPSTAEAVPKHSTFDSELFTALKITESPTKRQRTDVTDMEQ